MMKRTILTACLAVGLVSAAALPLMAHGGATGVVKERMDLFKPMGKTMKAIGPIALGDIDMNLKAVEEGATLIMNHAKMLPSKFPEGSLSDVSEAKANIWTDWKKFEGLMDQLAQEAEKLAELAKAGEEFELTDQFIKVANTCKACHKEFREKK